MWCSWTLHQLRYSFGISTFLFYICFLETDHYCECHEGYIDQSGDQRGPCLDIDECFRGEHTCDNTLANNPLFPDDVTTDCHNLDGTFECYCLEGYDRR